MYTHGPSFSCFTAIAAPQSCKAERSVVEGKINAMYSLLKICFATSQVLVRSRSEQPETRDRPHGIPLCFSIITLAAMR